MALNKNTSVSLCCGLSQPDLRAKKKKKRDYFRLRQTKESLRFNEAEGEERAKEKPEKEGKDE